MRKDGVPVQRKYQVPGQLKTNACPLPMTPNGLDFERTEVEEYNRIVNHEADERNELAESSMPVEELLGMSDEPLSDWAFNYKLKCQVEESRFITRPMAGRRLPSETKDED